MLADQHHGLRDSIRGLLEMRFETVFMVANEVSLLDGADRLRPEIVILDLSLAAGDVRSLLARVAERSSGSKVLMLSVHDEPSIVSAVLAAGADAVVLKRSLASDLIPTVDALLARKPISTRGVAP